MGWVNVHIYMIAQQGQKRASDPPRAGVTGGWELPNQCEPEQGGPLTAESLSNPSCDCLKCAHTHSTGTHRIFCTNEKWPCLERGWWAASMEAGRTGELQPRA